MQFSQSNSIHKVETPKMPYLLFIFSLCQNRRMFLAESQNAWKLQSLSESHNRRMFGNNNSFSCRVDFIVNQICCFTSTMKKKRNRNLMITCHTHPTEKVWQLRNDYVMTLQQTKGLQTWTKKAWVQIFTWHRHPNRMASVTLYTCSHQPLPTRASACFLKNGSVVKN